MWRERGDGEGSWLRKSRGGIRDEIGAPDAGRLSSSTNPRTLAPIMDGWRGHRGARPGRGRRRGSERAATASMLREAGRSSSAAMSVDFQRLEPVRAAGEARGRVDEDRLDDGLVPDVTVSMRVGHAPSLPERRAALRRRALGEARGRCAVRPGASSGVLGFLGSCDRPRREPETPSWSDNRAARRHPAGQASSPPTRSAPDRPARHPCGVLRPRAIRGD